MKITTGKIFSGNCIDTASKIKASTIQTVVTSPPYWKLRDYDLDDESAEGELGQEPTPTEYINHLVELFEAIKPALRNDGTVWLNLGDCYNGSGGLGGDFSPSGKRPTSGRVLKRKKSAARNIPTLKQTDLVGIPWMTALAMREAGWYLRSDVIWSKTTFMPNPVSSRPMSSHEHIFLFSKTQNYYYDQYSILTPRGTFPRDVWSMGNKKEKNLKHFATFPLELPLRCIKATTSEHGSCVKCGTPYKRKIKVIKRKNEKTVDEEKVKGKGTMHGTITPPSGAANYAGINYRETTGWEKQCDCRTNKVKPCRVLDPFMGSGTTAVAAERLHRHWVGLELYKTNCRIIKDRVKAEIVGADYMAPEKKALVKKIGFGISKRT